MAVGCFSRTYGYERQSSTRLNLISIRMFINSECDFPQHANEDVEKMILGNKCDMTDKRVVNKDRGEAVSIHTIK